MIGPSGYFIKWIAKLCALLLFICVLSTTTLPATQAAIALEAWQDPTVFRSNKLPPRAFYDLVNNQAAAFTWEPWEQSNYKLLNGTWKFKWVNSVSRRPKSFYTTDYDDSRWDDFAVPENWEMNSYGEPFYHSHYCFKPRPEPPKLPLSYNPVGSYRKKVTIDSSWADKQVILHFGAVKSAFYLYVNGQQVGYSEDSKTAAEFDITDYLNLGENLIALQVYRYSTGSYLECQDMWRVSGIERDVFLVATPKVRVADIHTKTSLTKHYTQGTLDFSATIANHSGKRVDGHQLAKELLDIKDRMIASHTIDVDQVGAQKQARVTHQFNVPDVQAWSAEQPNLFCLFVGILQILIPLI